MVSSLICIGGYDNIFDKTLQKDNTSHQIKMMLKATFSIKVFAQKNKKVAAYIKEAQEKFLSDEFKKKFI